MHSRVESAILKIMIAQKGLSPILIVLLIAAVIGGYLFYSGKMNLNQAKPAPSATNSPTSSDEIASWKTYTNTKYGYSLKYPSDWKVNLGVSGALGDDSKLETVYQIKLNSTTIPEDKLTIWVAAGKSSDNIDQFSANLGKTKTGADVIQIYSKEKTTLNGVEALKYVNSQMGVGQVMNVLVIKNGNAISLILEHPDTQPQNIPIFNQILSTFKFLDQNKTSDTSNQGVYTSKSNNYSFQYPTGYKLISEDNQTAVFGFSIGTEQPTPYLTITSKNLTDINSFKLCSQKPQNDTSTHCIALGSSWGQKNDVEDIVLGGRKAKSFYLGGGVDFAYHIVQTVDNPRLELKMYVAGGGLDKSFNQILSTFKFQ